MGKQIIKAGAERATRPKRALVWRDAASLVLAGLGRAEKEAVELACRTAADVLRLPVDYVVHAASGDMHVARVTEDLRLVYQVEPKQDRVVVLDLLGADAVDYLIGPNLSPNSNGEPATKS